MKRSEIIFGVVRLPIDFLVVLGSFWLAYYVRPITDLIPGIHSYFRPELLPSLSDYSKFSFYGTLFLIILFWFNNLYSLRNTHRFSREIAQLFFWVSAWLLMIIAYYFLIIHQLFFSRVALLHIWFFSLFFLAFSRGMILLLQWYLLRFGIGKRKVLLIGTGTLANSLYHALHHDPHYHIVGALSVSGDLAPDPSVPNGLKTLGVLADLESIIHHNHIEEVVQASQHENQHSADILSFCRYNQIKYHFVPDLLKLQRTNVEVEMIDNLPLVSLKATSLDGWGYVFKRVFDLVFSLVAIILLLPFWIVVAILIKIDSRGSVIYQSSRIYRDKVFMAYKLRSMVQNADDLKKDLANHNERSGPLFKIKNDPRVTRIGRFLRKTSLDELPQLFNVFTGTMSLVGPRPHLPEEVKHYEKHHRQVFAIKPGLTGLAQVSGRSDLDFEEEVRLDVYYIENWSPWLDLTIILKSIAVVLRCRGV